MGKKLTLDVNNLGTFDREWNLHSKCKEWWYATGFLRDSEGNLYSFQYTLLHINLGILVPKIAMVAFTDFARDVHHYGQQTRLGSRNISMGEKEATFAGMASATKGPEGIRITARHRDFELALDCSYGKGAFWHCDGGKLQMALPGPRETTFYYSYTNMPTAGEVTLDGKTFAVTGKTWFDRQGGEYSITNNATHWEWFSLRFHDDEEIMLFTFPQSNCQDGTYVTAGGKRERLSEYTLTRTKTIEKGGFAWSAGWEVTLPGIKEGHYRITPILESQINFVYFEELCKITNDSGEEVGLCFVELLPGVLNRKKIGIGPIFKRIEY